MSRLRAQVARRLPDPVAARAAGVFRSARAAAMQGSRVECPCCGGAFRSFVADHNGRRSVCPRCGSMPRHRLLWLWLAPRLRALPPPVRVLHVAPEPAIRSRLLASPNVAYLSVDLA